jgi:hypothetical protein
MLSTTLKFVLSRIQDSTFGVFDDDITIVYFVSNTYI